MSYVIGLTGGIASGKTTVANCFHDTFGVPIIDADIIAREVVEPGTPGLAAIQAHFGDEIVVDGALNRAALRERIFSHQEQKQWLNNLLHPLIREQILQQIQHVKEDYCLLVVPLLVENQLTELCDRVLVVDVAEETQIARTQQRDGVASSQVKSIIASQASRAERLAIADDVIDNDQANHELLAQVTDLHQKYLAISTKNRSKYKD
ncbi:dephospho-CoA kinase [Vibrio ulleungensis]|uniref:Dephospho-CoA kinase n=1 Tax=Vibrio ulleungensis TaxID=2807619 RepID=A0ABS2HK94_9VIBR|nr:dephospho-CoA kinase [Vibrio ulleungensis]MBM7037479.1 dephospho-CoA kinase [Vibrio ulleungensis]